MSADQTDFTFKCSQPNKNVTCIGQSTIGLSKYGFLLVWDNYYMTIIEIDDYYESIITIFGQAIQHLRHSGSEI